MAGRTIDLSDAATRLPARLVVDTSIVVDWLLVTAQRSSPPTPTTTEQLRAAQLVTAIQSDGTVGLVTSVGANEVFHFLIKTRYRTERASHQADLRARCPDVRRPDWRHLYKARSDLLKRFVADLDWARRLVLRDGFLFLQPEELGPIASGRRLEEELLWTIDRYQLDTSDAAILVEAARAGVSDIATSDADLRRAQRDFDVYTWL